jgi:hypothetical protein
LLGAAITAARTLRAQQKPMPVIGYLDTGSLNAFPSYLAAFREGLSLTGYVEGRDVAVEYRWAEGRLRLAPLLADAKTVVVGCRIEWTRQECPHSACQPTPRYRSGAPPEQGRRADKVREQYREMWLGRVGSHGSNG